ncbi:MAG: SoxR reducing system RseC family protein [Mangrovibacterium sp.]
MAGEISHKGVVKEFSPERVVVTILAESACAGCHARGVCSAADLSEKEIEITPCGTEYQPGQQVLITGKTSQGFKALFLGYLCPFILLITVLILTLSLTGEEGLSGLLALGTLLPYYLIIYLLRNKIKRSFDFKIGPLPVSI